MDRTWARVAITLALLLPATALAGGPGPVISLRADSWYPINGDPAAPRPGFAIEILDEIWSADGYQLDYQLDASWADSLAQVRNADIDCVVGAYITDAPDLLFPKEHLILDEMSFYVRHDNDWQFTGVDSLGEVRLAVMEAYSYGETLDQWVAARPHQIHVGSGHDGLDDNLRALVTGDASVLIESTLVMSARLEGGEFAHLVRRAGVAPEREALYVACAPDLESSRIYLDSYDAGMHQLRASGRLAEILERYAIPESFAGEVLD